MKRTDYFFQITNMTSISVQSHMERFFDDASRRSIDIEKVVKFYFVRRLSIGKL